MKKPEPLYYKGEPVLVTKPFTAVFEAALDGTMEAMIMSAAKGWPDRSEHWGADHKTEKRQWPNPACSSYAAYNALCCFARLHGLGRTVMNLDPMDIHSLAMEIDGLEGGDAESMTTLQAAMEAAAQLANQAAGRNFVYWSRVPVDLIGAWQSVVSPVAVPLTWWWDWTRYSFIWRTLIWPHDNPKPVANHAIALVGHLPRKAIGVRKRCRAFEVHDSQGEKVWIQDYALVKSIRGKDAFGFIATQDLQALRKGRKADGLREP